ncbi:hypothetical protein CMI44_01750 [Candidatus Pacearchaeota archaeon]|jgi:RNA-binding protein YhbY|nr:hypothetical protein [Candidatus Pacearchaeota archaeon]|tara:strand:- start:1050 stop:1298 length:249 start_codon:yes stop_codon:yes gene_type:complete
MAKIIFCQIGKNRITENFIKTIENHFKKNKVVRIKVLRSACRDRDELKKIKDSLLKKLGRAYSARIIGYVIVLRKLRKNSSK